MARTARKSVLMLAEAYGAGVEVSHSGSVTTVLVDAPDGYFWYPDGVSAFRAETRGGFSDRDWRDLLERMRASSLAPHRESAS